MVWCTGWPEWKPASDALNDFTPSVPPPIPTQDGVILEEHREKKSFVKQSHATAKRIRRDRARAMTLALSGLALLLLIAVLLVINRSS